MKEYSQEEYHRLAFSDEPAVWGDLPYAEVLSLLSLHSLPVRGLHLVIRRRALEKLLAFHSVPTIVDRPLQKGSVLSRVGYTNLSFRDLKAQLVPLGIEVSELLNDETTHVLIGLNPRGGTRGLEKYRKTLLTDQLLQAELNRLAHLQKEEKKALQAELNRLARLQKEEKKKLDRVQRLSDLLMTLNDESIQLALKLINKGGFPKSLIPHAFLALKIVDNQAIRVQLQAILEEHLSEAGKSMMRNISEFSFYMSKSYLEEATKKSDEQPL